MSDNRESLREYKAKLQATQAKHVHVPLIEQVTNDWKSEKGDTQSAEGVDDSEGLGFCDFEDESSCPHAIHGAWTSRRFRRMIAFVVFLMLVVYYGWSRIVQPQLQEGWDFEEGFVSHENGTYGVAKGGDLDPDLVRIKHLDHKLLPGGPADAAGKRRLIFVGDVHGCKTELVELMREVGFDKDTDHLVLTGDVISKGPDNVGVLDELIRLKATSVRGNHEDRILHVAKTMDTSDLPPTEASSSKGFAKDAALLKQLKPHHLRFLREFPLMLHIPALPQAPTTFSKSKSIINKHILVVHAGLVPNVPLDRQDPYYVMNMRSINRRTHVPSAMRNGKDKTPWFDVWGWYNDRLHTRSITIVDSSTAPNKGKQYRSESAGWLNLWNLLFGDRRAKPKPQVVVYGHDSKAGLQIRRWSKGLDSACVSGGKLTALILNAKGTYELRSVRCKNYRG